MMPLNVWPNTALGCKYQSICMFQLQPVCSAALLRNVLPRDVTRPQPHEAEAEATTHEAEAEATTHEAEAEATTHEAEAEAEAKTHL